MAIKTGFTVYIGENYEKGCLILLSGEEIKVPEEKLGDIKK